MDKKSKIFFWCFFSIIFIAIAISFYKYFISKDYYIKAEVECNPEKEKCFMAKSDSSETINYYKIIEKKAHDIPPMICQEGEDCKEIFCDKTTKPEGVECSP